jgi:hypothetical protein
VAWIQEGELLEQIERPMLCDSPERGDQELAHFGFINREYFQSASIQKFPHTYIFTYLHWQNNVGEFLHIVHLLNSGFLKHSAGNKRKFSGGRSLVTVWG